MTGERAPLKVIRLSPALLTYQDQMKKRNFLQSGAQAVAVSVEHK
ncbi:MAG: hypothetical protein R3E95_05400 [Thiolinea sp.]